MIFYKIKFEEVDEFFLSRGQLVPEDDLIIKCANATLPALPVIEAMELEFEVKDDDDELGCQCAQFKNINQSGFMIFATWMFSNLFLFKHSLIVKVSYSREWNSKRQMVSTTSNQLLLPLHAERRLSFHVSPCSDVVKKKNKKLSLQYWKVWNLSLVI